jgi:hypothetical protein
MRPEEGGTLRSPGATSPSLPPCAANQDRELILRIALRYEFARRIPRISAILTRSASDLVPIFFIMCPRCIFTVISAMPISAASVCSESGSDQRQHLPLPGCQGLEKSPRVRDNLLIFAPDRARSPLLWPPAFLAGRRAYSRNRPLQPSWP